MQIISGIRGSQDCGTTRPHAASSRKVEDGREFDFTVLSVTLPHGSFRTRIQFFTAASNHLCIDTGICKVSYPKNLIP
jgi:hypothetical protein